MWIPKGAALIRGRRLLEELNTIQEIKEFWKGKRVTAYAKFFGDGFVVKHVKVRVLRFFQEIRQFFPESNNELPKSSVSVEEDSFVCPY